MLDVFFRNLSRHATRAITLGVAIVVLDCVVWNAIFFHVAEKNLRVYFLSVGQGDSELVALPGGAKMLIDGGPANGRVLDALGAILPMGDRYIDLVVLSHPQEDHYGGLMDVLKRYQVGAVLWTGQTGTATSFSTFQKLIQENGVRSIVLQQDDRIRYGNARADVVWPTIVGGLKNLNDAPLVIELTANGTRILFTGDLGSASELALLDTFHDHVDVLKVGHHGSKYASSQAFLNALQPKVAVIEVGKNTYGHPAPITLERLRAVGTAIFRTDTNGTVQVVSDGERLKIFEN